MCQQQPRRSSLKKHNKSSSSSSNKQSVKFATKQRVKKIPALCTFSDADIDAVWYNQREVDTITQFANELVLKAEASPEGATVRDLDGDCIRGLERKTQDGHSEAFLSRVAVYDAVLDEQDKQWNTSKDELDMDKIASLSLKASKKAKQSALQRAKQDEAEIQVYLHVEKQAEAEPEPELDLEQVFAPTKKTKNKKSSSQISLANHFLREDNLQDSIALVKAHDSWITRSTASTASMSSFDQSLEEDSDHGSSNNSAASTTKTSNSSSAAAAAVKRTSLTTAKKVMTPAVPRPSGKTGKKRCTPKRTSTFKGTDQTALAARASTKTTPAPPKKKVIPVTTLRRKSLPLPPSRTKSLPVAVKAKPPTRRKSSGLCLECSAFQ